MYSNLDLSLIFENISLTLTFCCDVCYRCKQLVLATVRAMYDMIGKKGENQVKYLFEKNFKNIIGYRWHFRFCLLQMSETYLQEKQHF